MDRISYIKSLVNRTLNEGFSKMSRGYRNNANYKPRHNNDNPDGSRNVFCPSVTKVKKSINGQEYDTYRIKICGIYPEDMDFIAKNGIAKLRKSNAIDWTRDLSAQKDAADVLSRGGQAHYLYTNTFKLDWWLENAFPELIDYLSKKKQKNGEDKYNVVSFKECREQITRKAAEALNNEEFKKYSFENDTVEFNNMRISEFEAKIREALESGDWETAVAEYKLDLKSRLFGNVLTTRNKKSIYTQARNRGLTENDPNWPTFVRSRVTWERLGFKIKPNAQPYIIGSFIDNGQNPEYGLKQMGFTDDEVKIASQQMIDVGQKTGIGRVWPGPAYDISDVEDVTNGGRWMKEAGLVNNLEGILNQAAIDFENNRDDAAKTEFEKKRAEQLKKIESIGGQAEIFNDLLLDYVSENNQKHRMNISLNNRGNSMVEVYLNNLYNYANQLIQYKWDAAGEIESYSNIFRSIVASQTIGVEHAPKIQNQNVNKYLSEVIGEAHRIIKYMARNAFKEYQEYQEINAQPAQAVNEAVEEVFTNDDFSTYQDKLNKFININPDYRGYNRDAKGHWAGKSFTYLYHATGSAGKNGISKNGPSRIMTGKNSNFYGPGVYTNWDLGDAIAGTQIYGDYIIKFALKGDFKDFLIFDEGFNRTHGTGENIKQQLERLAPEILQYMQKHFDENTYRYVLGRSKNVFHYHGGYRGSNRAVRTAEQVRAFLGTPKMWRGLKFHCWVPDEMLAASKIRGYIFQGSGDGRVIVVRNFTNVLPVAWTSKSEAENWFNKKDRTKNIWHTINEETFNKLNQKHDAQEEFASKYPKIDPREQNTAGYVRVPKGNKWNFINPDTKEEIFPFDFDFATNFSPMSREATVEINGEEYLLYSDMDGTLHIKDEFNDKEFSFDEFVAFIQSQTKDGLAASLGDKSKIVSESFHKFLQRMDNYQIL